MPSTKPKSTILLGAKSVKTRTCPGCRSDPGLMLGLTQWRCDNEGCPVLFWHPEMEAAEQPIHRIDLGEDS